MIYRNIEECNIGKNHKTLIPFDDMIAEMINNEKPVTEFFVRSRKLSISFIFITQSYFRAPKDVTKFYPLFYFENSQ